MSIDAHQHFWIYDSREYGWIDDSMALLRRNFLPEDLEPLLRRHTIEGCIAVQARQSLEESRWLLELANRHSFIRGVVGWVDLQSDRVEDTLHELALHSKFRGVRHVVQDEPDDRFLLRSDFRRGIRCLRRFDLAYDLLLKPRHLPAAVKLVEEFPDQRFVLDHLAKPLIREQARERAHEPWKEHLRALAAHPQVFCKLSGLVTEADWHSWQPREIEPFLDAALEAFGPERLMFGSDWPVCLLAADYSSVVELVQRYLARHGTLVERAVMSSNALRFYSPRTAA